MKLSMGIVAAFGGACVGVVALALSAVASAHVVVKPAEVVTAGFQTFTIGVPNEKAIPTTEVKLAIPEGLQYVSPTVKSGWSINVEKEGSGEDATVKSITWSGGEIGEGLRDDFTFSAKVPENATELQWKAYQTYADGTVVSWDQAESDNSHGGGNSGPFSVTKVVTETSQDTAAKKADQAAADASHTARQALYVGIAGVVVGMIGIFFATRR